MGYYTHYTIFVYDCDVYEAEEIRQYLADKAGTPFDLWMTSDGATLVCREATKWYECDLDMIDLSLMHPEATFRVHGHGEDYHDIWILYAKNGTIEHEDARFVFDEPSFIDSKYIFKGSE